MIAQTEIDQLSDALGDSDLSLQTYLIAAAILVVAIVLGRVVRATIRRVVSRSRADDFLGQLIGRLANYLIVVFGVVYALETLGIAIGPILGALGIVGIALAFAFQDILENFVAGIILQVQRPFGSGDEVVTADYEGVVTSVDARTITLRTPDGEIVRIPSADVIKQPIVNHTENGRRRTTVSVGVAYGTDLPRARAIALDAVRNLDAVLAEPEPEVLVEAFGASSVDLAVRFWHPPSIAQHWTTRNDVASAVAVAFSENGIEIPFPQRVVHLPSED